LKGKRRCSQNSNGYNERWSWKALLLNCKKLQNCKILEMQAMKVFGKVKCKQWVTCCDNFLSSLKILFDILHLFDLPKGTSKLAFVASICCFEHLFVLYYYFLINASFFCIWKSLKQHLLFCRLLCWFTSFPISTHLNNTHNLSSIKSLNLNASSMKTSKLNLGWNCWSLSTPTFHT